MNIQGDFHDMVSDEPITGGVLLRRFPDGIETNVPHRVIEHSPTGYEWGYHGSGPADLALNILESALRAMGHDGQRQECWRGSCYRLAWTLHQDFKREFIVTLPHEGDVIYWPALRAWITDKATQAGICLGCGESLDPLGRNLTPDDYGLNERDGATCPACGAWRPSP